MKCVQLCSSLIFFCHYPSLGLSSLVAQKVKHLPTMREIQVWSLGQEDPLEKEMAPTPVLLPGESHGWRSLIGYSPWGHKESDVIEQLHFHFFIYNYQIKICCRYKYDCHKIQEWMWIRNLFMELLENQPSIDDLRSLAEMHTYKHLNEMFKWDS